MALCKTELPGHAAADSLNDKKQSVTTNPAARRYTLIL
jgi:hypothetical protein